MASRRMKEVKVTVLVQTEDTEDPAALTITQYWDSRIPSNQILRENIDALAFAGDLPGAPRTARMMERRPLMASSKVGVRKHLRKVR